MGWPQVIAGVVGVIASTRYVILARSKAAKEAQELVYNLIPRYFLLQALYEMQSRFPFLYKGEKWNIFHAKIKSVLEVIQVALGEDSRGEKLDARGQIKRVCIAVDTHLLSYLQKQRELSQLLHEYLPGSGQSWADFLRDRSVSECLENDSDLEDQSDSEIDSNLSVKLESSEGKRLEALDRMRILVCSFLDDLEQMSSSIVDAIRGKEEITDARVKAVPSTYERYKVFYATDRQVTEDGEYSGSRSKRDGLHYGHMVVGIPRGKKKGEKSSPQRHEDADPLHHIVILSINTELRGDKEGFKRELDEAIHSETEGDGMANAVLLYIHGYNVRHKDAIKSAAQLQHDLEFKGQAIAYSWSSRGNLLDYHHDEQEIGKTVACLEGFIKTIVNEIPEYPDVHIVAHSMGNRALIKALHNLIEKRTPLRNTLQNVVFAAADESREIFDEMVRKLPAYRFIEDQSEVHERTYMRLKPPQITVYSSKDDQAMSVSMLVHGLQNRLGDTKSFLKTKEDGKGSDQVDVSGRRISKAWLQHSYYCKVPEVLQDMHLLLEKWDAEQRSRRVEPLIKAVSYRGKNFYAFQASQWGDQQRCL